MIIFQKADSLKTTTAVVCHRDTSHCIRKFQHKKMRTANNPLNALPQGITQGSPESFLVGGEPACKPKFLRSSFL